MEPFFLRAAWKRRIAIVQQTWGWFMGCVPQEPGPMPLFVAAAGRIGCCLALLSVLPFGDRGHRCWCVTWTKMLRSLFSCLHWRLSHQASNQVSLQRAEENVSQDKGNFLLPKETLDHIFNHLSIQRAARLGHLEVIIGANLFFDIFYWIFSSLIQTWKDYDPIMWPVTYILTTNWTKSFLLICCVAMGESLNFSMPQLLHL